MKIFCLSFIILLSSSSYCQRNKWSYALDTINLYGDTAHIRLKSFYKGAPFQDIEAYFIPFTAEMKRFPRIPFSRTVKFKGDSMLYHGNALFYKEYGVRVMATYSNGNLTCIQFIDSSEKELPDQRANNRCCGRSPYQGWGGYYIGRHQEVD